MLKKFVSGPPKFTSRILTDSLIKHLVLINFNKRRQLLQEIDSKLGAEFAMQDEFYNRARSDLSKRLEFDRYQIRSSSTGAYEALRYEALRAEYPSMTDDGRTIIMSQDMRFTFTPRQRRVIALLLDKYRIGESYFLQSTILYEIDKQDTKPKQKQRDNFILTSFKNIFGRKYDKLLSCTDRHPEQKDLWRLKRH